MNVFEVYEKCKDDFAAERQAKEAAETEKIDNSEMFKVEEETQQAIDYEKLAELVAGKLKSTVNNDVGDTSIKEEKEE